MPVREPRLTLTCRKCNRDFDVPPKKTNGYANCPHCGFSQYVYKQERMKEIQYR